MKRELIVAIDGPSGAGKSTLSKMLARKLGYINIDTGAMYRAVALDCSRKGVDLQDDAALKAFCENARIEFHREDGVERVILNGEDVSEAIRTPENSLLTSKISSLPVVREAMVALQRKMGERGGVVLEGRDIGTVVFPHAEVKIFLIATARERGKRRYDELKAKGMDVDLEQTVREVEARDAADSSRAVAPLKQADDAWPLDSTSMTIEEVLDEMIRIVETKRAEL